MASTSLLLLPTLPSPSTIESIQAAHGDTIAATLSSLSSKKQSQLQRLDIAVCTPTAWAPKTSRFRHWQSIISLIYQVVCVKAAETNVELDIDNGIDARVFICDSFLDVRSSRVRKDDEADDHVKQGPIINLQTLAASGQRYSSIYSAESEEGEKVNQKFKQASPDTQLPEIIRVPGGTILHASKPGGPRSSLLKAAHPDPDTSHKWVAVGGTFDHLHIGHKLLLTGVALALSNTGDRNLTIGITGDALLVNKSHASVLESWETRQKRTASFLESIMLFPPSNTNPNPHPQITSSNNPAPNEKHITHTYALTSGTLTITYVQILDPFGPTITEEQITALVISAETRAGGAAVNKKRAEKGWKELDVLEIDVVDTADAVRKIGGGDGAGGAGVQEADFRDKISSTAIRRKIVERRSG